MINPGLTLLIRLGWRGTLRAWWRRLRTLKGALTGLAIAPIAVLVLGSQLYVLVAAPASELPRPTPADLRLFGPALALFLLLMEAWTGRALAFRPQELDFLFPAPVSRRELLAYHLLSRYPVRFLSGLWFAVFAARMAGHPLGGVLAPLLLFTLVHVATELIALLGAASAAWAGAWRSRALWLAGAGIALWSAASAVASTGGMGAGLRAALDTPALRLAALPMRPLAEVFAAPTAGVALGWALLAAAEIALMTGLVFALDVAYTERAVAVSRRALERLRRAGAGHAAGVARPWKLRLRVPLPRLPGGALAWRQTLELLRSPRALALPFAIPAIYLSLFLAVPLARGQQVAAPVAFAAVAAALMVPLLMPNIGFDFRRDLDRMAELRALPLRPTALAIGQLFAPVASFVLAQWAVVAAVSAASTGVAAAWLLGALTVGLPLTWAVMAVDNLLFLWMPYRFSPDGSQNAQFAGKTMLVMGIKLIVVLLIIALASIAGYGAYTLTRTPAAAAGAAALILVLSCLPLTWAVGAAFQGFDLASDMPA